VFFLLDVRPLGFNGCDRFFPPFSNLLTDLNFVSLQGLDEGVNILLLVSRTSFPKLKKDA
jgi:hypothetical protein